MTLPEGLEGYAQRLGTAAELRLTGAGSGGVVGDVGWWLDAPARTGGLTAPVEPLRWGTGALCVDLGPDDGPTWERCAATLPDGTSAEDVAAEAQRWRLPVTPFRRLGEAVTRPPSLGECAVRALLEAGSADGTGDRPATSAPSGQIERTLAEEQTVEEQTTGASPALAGVKVVELASHWAGPTCTQLLARAGAEVVKVESPTRPDGLRGTPTHFAELNDGKRLAQLDLATSDGRAAFSDLLATADLLVTSLSRRALGNLGLLPWDLAAPVSTLSITAFSPDSPEASWTAYGAGVHAACGLGWVGDEPEPCDYAYPDPLSGLAAAAIAADLLREPQPAHATVALADVVAPMARAVVAACEHARA